MPCLRTKRFCRRHIGDHIKSHQRLAAQRQTRFLGVFPGAYDQRRFFPVTRAGQDGFDRPAAQGHAYHRGGPSREPPDSRKLPADQGDECQFEESDQHKRGQHLVQLAPEGFPVRIMPGASPEPENGRENKCGMRNQGGKYIAAVNADPAGRKTSRRCRCESKGTQAESCQETHQVGQAQSVLVNPSRI